MMGLFEKLSVLQSFMRKYHRILVLCGTPFIFSPILIAVDTLPSRTAYALLIMVTFWITEVTPLAVTSLLPLIIFPFLGILKASDVCTQYMKDTNILLIGSLLIALAVEQWNLHKRVALSVVMLVGVEPSRLMLGFMLVTAFLSMWMSNTATTAMMIPIIEAVLKELEKQLESGPDVVLNEVNEDEEKYILKHDSLQARSYMHSFNEMEMKTMNTDEIPPTPELIADNNSSLKVKEEQRHRFFCKALLLSVCYSANIGGTGTLTGAKSQLVFAGQLDQMFPNGPKVSFMYWFVYGFPQMLVFLFIGWLYLQALFMGISSLKDICSCFRWRNRTNSKKVNRMYVNMKNQYDDLGPITFVQIIIGLHFILLILLWFFREPKFMPGWGDLFKAGYVSDATAAIIVAFLLFQMPSQVPDCLNFSNVVKEKVHSKTILEWDTASKKIHWTVVFLLGAGYSVAKACEDSGLSLWLSCQLSGLKVIPEAGIVFVICLMITFITEFTSNIATSSIFLPILASLSQSIHVNPLYMMVPAATCASFAFMLPVATPPNALVFGTGRITVTDMAKAGFGMNIIGILVVTLAINTWGYSFYELGTFPDWAKATGVASRCGGVNGTLTSNTTAVILTNSTF